MKHLKLKITQTSQLGLQLKQLQGASDQKENVIVQSIKALYLDEVAEVYSLSLLITYHNKASTEDMKPEYAKILTCQPALFIEVTGGTINATSN
jgi:hypothetical protein